MKTVTFVYTDGVTYKAANVLNIYREDELVEYTQQVINTDETIGGLNIRAVDTSDLLYAVVKDHDTQEITIIPGLYNSFDVVPKGEAVRRQAAIEAEAARVKAAREAAAPAREAKEKAKFEQRRAARKAAWLAEHPGDAQATPAFTAPTAPANPTPAMFAEVAETATSEDAVYNQLKAAGISDRDLAVLRNVLK